MIRSSQVVALIVGGLVLTGAGVWLGARHGGDSSAQASGQVLPLRQSELNAVTRLRISKGDGSHTTLSRSATQWIVAERGYAADSGQVRKLLLDLSALHVEEQKTADPALYAKLNVETPSSVHATSTGIDIDVNGKTLGLIVGKTSGTGSVYVRRSDQAQSLLVSPQLAPDADPRHWLDRSLLDLAPDQITEISVEPPGGPAYTIKRSGSDANSGYNVTPIPKGRELSDPSAAASQAGALTGLQLDDVRKAASVKATAQSRFTTRDGLTLAIAGIPDGELRYITVAASASGAAAQQRATDLNSKFSGWEFELPGYRYDTLFRPLEQLLKPLPAKPAPAPGKTAHGPVASPAASPAAPPQSH